MKRMIRNDSGFTLIEVMVSMIILSIGVLGLAPLMAVSVTGNSFSNEATRANVLAQDRIEQLKNMAFGAMPYADSTSSDPKFGCIADVDDESSDATVPSGVYRIYVKITWTDQSGVDRRLQFFTYRTK
jgi:type IV pilus modification protein PilV